MTQYLRITLCCLFVAASAAAAAARGDEVPAWLQQAAAAQVPAYPQKDYGNVPAVVLHQEQQIVVSQDGRVTQTDTYAVRLLLREGRAFAAARAYYTTDGGKVRDIRAWLIRPSGQVKRYGKDEAPDWIAEPNDIYNELRYREISARDDAEAGAVFGYQTVTEYTPLVNEQQWGFQYTLPTLVSRFTLTLPQGWRASDLTFNHPKVTPAVSGSTYVWELRNLMPLPDEPASPAWTNIAPRLAVSYAPEGGAAAGMRAFSNWSEISRWESELSDPSADSNEALAAKAAQLTAGAQTELDKIKAIARYVQGIQYISIDINVSRGGGLRPRPATQVFAKNYGDCKDKANLMRAMLKVVGIESYLVSIYSGDPNFVRAEWVSPAQFNHCIIAVKVTDATQAPTVIAHPKLGRLLIFDATDEHTPVGDLPDHEQGSLALIVAGAEGALVRMPSTPPEANRFERTTEVTLLPDGSITASLRQRAAGQAAVKERVAFRKLARPEYAAMIQGWITRGATGAKVSKVEPADSQTDGRFSLDVDFSVEGYGQVMAERLLVFKPAIVSRRESVFLTGDRRKHPVVLEPHAYTETVKVKLPAGFDVDELPDPVKLEAPFGSYSTSYEVKDGQLHFTRAFTQRASTIPPDGYPQVRSFFERIRAAEQSPVVLARK